MQPTNKKQAAKPPVSAHPAFPVIVALWFCALFGIGSMVLPAALLEKVVASTGISVVIPAAAPPLGMTARILIALAAAGIGVVAGLFVARKVAASQGNTTPARSRSIASGPEEKAESTADPLSTKKPISAHEELGSDRFDAPFDDDENEVMSVAHNAESDAESDSLRFHTVLQSDEVHDDALELAAFAEGGEEIAADEYGIPLAGPQAPIAHASIAGSDEEPAPLANEKEAMADHIETAPFATTDANGLPASAQAEQAPATHPADNILNRPVEELSIAGLVERFAHALETHRASVAAQANAAPAPQYSDQTPDSAHETRPSTAHRESVPAAPPPPYVPSALRPIAIDDDDEGFGDEHISDFDPTSALTCPTYSAGHTTDYSASNRAAEHVPFTLTRDSFAEPANVANSDYDGCESNDEYSSLLTMKSPFTLPREPAQVYDEDDREASDSKPTAAFPGQSDRQTRTADNSIAHLADGLDTIAQHSDFNPATAVRHHDAAETERRLREALEKLQRMSGAA
ncbi:hypothetical protein EB810_01745 [Altererythrobacter sp. FM1]|uniref:hypothetical protein n=1 Tax=Tsuneonella flava TaxID=2055955 RepID=UPI000C80F499|nr:hypothetical protein [Tsuneonella flava]ROT96702.1 hypothetical protein EB810_01745 [Altererythrobacter sp. FM1]